MLANPTLTVRAGSGLTGGGLIALGGITTLSLNPNINGLASTFSDSNASQVVSITQRGAGAALSVTGGGYGLSSTGLYGVYAAGLTDPSGGSSGIGVFAEGPAAGVNGDGAPNGTGVYGTGFYGVMGQGSTESSGGGIGVYGEGTNVGVWGYSDSNTYAVFGDGNIGATGTITADVLIPDNRVVELYSMESPELWSEDFGSGELRNGVGEVPLDPTFALSVNTRTGYHVFLTPNGDCEGLYVAQKTATGFQVRELRGGKSNVEFDYRIVAKRRGYENVRMDQLEADSETVQAIRAGIQNRPAHRRLVLHKPPMALKAPPRPPTVGASPAAREAAIPHPPDPAKLLTLPKQAHK